MLLIKKKYFYILLALFSILLFIIINANRTEISPVKITDPLGKNENSEIPFISSHEGEPGIYVYELKLLKTGLFNGSLHLIPDDCIEETLINGKIVPSSLFRGDKCDNQNGGYLDISRFTKSGMNKVILKVRNNQGFYGLNIIDTTFYEGYYLLFISAFFLLFIRYKYVWKLLSSSFYSFYRENRTVIYILLFQVLVLSLNIFLGRYLKDQGMLRWILVIQVILIVGVPIIMVIYKTFLFGKITTFLFIITGVICFKYLYSLFYDQFAYDVEGHIQYIQYLIERGRAPLASGGWVFYHPSFYYRSAAFFYSTLDFNSRFNYEEFLKIIQSFSMCVFMVYCFFSLKTIDLIFRKQLMKNNVQVDRNIKFCYLVTVSIFILWSSNPMFSVRIGNDIFFDLLFSMSFYFLVKWWLSPADKYLTLALLCAALDVWTKSNGFILFGIIGICLLGKSAFENQRKQHLSRMTLFAVCFIITLFFSFHHKIKKINHDPNARILVDNANFIGSEMHVETTFSNFLTFNPVKFIDIPFTNALDDSKGRQNFWFFLFKTSLFSEFPYNFHALILLAKTISFLFLVLLMYSLWGLTAAFKRIGDYLPIVTAILTMIGSMILFRVYYPFSCSNDFRYIFPAILPFSLLIGIGLLFPLSRSRSFFFCSSIVVLTFVVSCGLFQVINILTL